MEKMMSNKRLTVVTTMTAVGILMNAPLAAQNETWQMPRTSWGAPLIQGYWSNATMVPMQRPADLGSKEFYSLEELQEKPAP
jgi:hypothetical protein